MRKKQFFFGALFALFSLGSASAQNVVQTIYVDFGEPDKDSRGHITSGVDAYGHYWTNVKSSGNNYAYPGISFDIVNSNNDDTGYSILLNTRFMSNGRTGGGGLLSPSSELIGDLAVETATEDYFFLESFQNYNFMTFRGLDKSKGYKFYSFGSRVTEETRAAEYLFCGENRWSGTHQMSGKGIGSNGYNGNNNTVLESDVVFPDKDGNITFAIIKKNISGMVHINAMKIEEIDGMERPNQNLTLAQRIYIDVGETANDSRGHQTEGADVNGNYWNNLTSGKSSSNQIPKGTKLNLVNSLNVTTGITAETLQMMETNGVNAGGVNEPLRENLGDLAVKTATEDYVWINDNNSRDICFSGLNKNNCYKFYVFGSRIVDEQTDRNSIYTLTGQDTWSTWLTTTGRCIGGRDANGKDIHGNVRNVAVSDYVYPDKNGNITFTVKRERGMAHFNIIKIEEYTGAQRPEDAPEFEQIAVSGTASENGEDVAMHELAPGGMASGVFEAYLKLQPGIYFLKGITTSKEHIILGSGDKEGFLVKNGQPFSVAEEKIVRVRYDSRKSYMTVTPVELYVKGNIVPSGTRIEYAGNSVWRSEVALDEGNVFLFSDKYFYFVFNNDETLAVKRLSGSRSMVAMPAEGFNTENIRLNRGTYTLSLNMADYEFSIDAPVDEAKISVFGSSVANGQGADGNRGYAYLYGNALHRRYQKHDSDYDFYTSGISIGGNTTINLLDRYDEMIHDFGRYVIVGLSMGNEGLHEAASKQTVFNQFRDNMLTIIRKIREDGKIPVVMNNYTRGDYSLSDYTYVKRMNLLIHEWDVPSVNVLGAIDNGSGRWADGYMQDNAHPNTLGHNEFFYAMTPSLFDALAANKPQPVRDMTAETTLSGTNVIKFTGEGTVHPYTVGVRFKGGDAGILFTVDKSTGRTKGNVSVNADGYVEYTSHSGEKIVSGIAVSDDDWHTVSLVHYYAQKRTLLYVDKKSAGELSECIAPGEIVVGDAGSDVSRLFGELFFWRSALTPNEVGALVDGKMLKSSLEIYSPLSKLSAGIIENLAQSNNAAVFVDNVSTDLNTVDVANGSNLEFSTNDGTLTIITGSATNVSVSSVDGRTVFSGIVNGRKEMSGLKKGVYVVNDKKVVLN